MKMPSEREKTLESLLESLIKMLGKSNQRVDDLNKRVNQLELFLREFALHDSKTEQSNIQTPQNSYTLTN